MILGISQRELLIAVIVQSEMPAISQAAHSKSVWNTKSSGTYQPIMSNPVISTLISKRHVIWWVCPILWYSQLLPSNQSTCFLWLSWHSFLPIFFVLAFEGLATPGRPCVSRIHPWRLPTRSAWGYKIFKGEDEEYWRKGMPRKPKKTRGSIGW